MIPSICDLEKATPICPSSTVDFQICFMTWPNDARMNQKRKRKHSAKQNILSKRALVEMIPGHNMPQPSASGEMSTFMSFANAWTFNGTIRRRVWQLRRPCLLLRKQLIFIGIVFGKELLPTQSTSPNFPNFPKPCVVFVALNLPAQKERCCFGHLLLLILPT